MFAISKTDTLPGVTAGEAPEPQLRPGMAKIRIIASSVCGTDLGLIYDWERHSATWNSPLPMVLGHECSAEVVDVADDVVGLEKGQVVVVETHMFCGNCLACRNGAEHNCLNMQIPGVSQDGIWSEYAVLPANALYQVQPGIDPAQASLLEAAGVAMHAAQRAQDIAGKTVAVTGAGPVALFLIAILKSKGAANILVSEPSEARRRKASALGAVAFSPAEQDQFLQACRDFGTIAGADVGFEVSGALPAYETMFNALGKESTLVSIGHTSQPIPVNISRDVNLRVINWKGTFGRHLWSSWEEADALVRSGVLDLSEFIGHTVQLEELPAFLPNVAEVPGKVLVQHG